MAISTPVDSIIERQGFLMLDGGLSTALEVQGAVLDTPLWSAQLLIDNPGAISTAHRSYLEAGADCIITATYQASVSGFLDLGYTAQTAQRMINRAVTLAIDARDAFAPVSKSPGSALVAASIGPYGAYLTNGAEYRGDYGVSRDTLRSFHADRWEVLAQSKVELFACETIPSMIEAEVLLSLLQETPHVFAWFSFSCQDGMRISDGTPISTCAALVGKCNQVVGIGVNCTAPQYISSLIEQAQVGAPGKVILVYPNSGEQYNGFERRWMGHSVDFDWGQAARTWHLAGARMIGGCCRMGPPQIKVMREALNRKSGA
jgi:homocysteine S-methyltransferase